MTANLATATRQDLLKRALFCGHLLTLNNPRYMRTLDAIVGTLLAEDCEPQDLTVASLGLEHRRSGAQIIVRQPGVAAGIQEAERLVRLAGAAAIRLKDDGDPLTPGDALLEMHGHSGTLLSLERVCLNLLQRMCGIAAATRRWQELAQRHSRSARLVATRKTPWGLLDKRAVHCGGGGTHRLSLGDAILIKNNHLALLGGSEAEAVPAALETAWRRRGIAAFVEVEVRGLQAARVAARTFQRLQSSDLDSPPCLILLDNMTPGEIARIVGALQAESLWDKVLIEASGRISEDTIGAYAASGVDAISAGALTHSIEALDLRQELIPAKDNFNRG
ncbi:MAG: carboxylating nicotinate-nucleotide diphosphorylase [Bryobacteraceae bacterium]|jgi:nicotinate-nucleotide pyrophosphorylase (carboxylating)